MAALRETQEPIKKMVAEFTARRNLMVDGINSIPGLNCTKPQGAFYAFTKFNYDMPSVELAKLLIEKAHVAVTPGSAFGRNGEGYIRLSYATSREKITEGLKRVKNALAEL